MPPRKTAFGRLMDHFHTHPKGRLHEVLFWGGIGVGLLAVTGVFYFLDLLGDAFALLAIVIALCFIGFALLPPARKHKHADEGPTRGKRAVIAQQVKASKAEKKRKPRTPLR